MHSYEECLNAVRKKFSKPIAYSFEYKNSYIFYVCMSGSVNEQTFGNPLYKVNPKTLEIKEFRKMYDSSFISGDKKLQEEIAAAYKATAKPVDIS